MEKIEELVRGNYVLAEGIKMRIDSLMKPAIQDDTGLNPNGKVNFFVIHRFDLHICSALCILAQYTDFLKIEGVDIISPQSLDSLRRILTRASDLLLRPMNSIDGNAVEQSTNDLWAWYEPILNSDSTRKLLLECRSRAGYR